MSESYIYNRDCIEAMKEFPDYYFDLAIVDPPYGIKEGRRKSYHKNALTTYTPKSWDNNVPTEEYWKELFRVSANQIVWGGHYFTNYLPISKKWIIWDKMQPEGLDQAMFDMAWNSQQNIQAKIYRQSTQSTCNKVANNKQKAKKYIRIHPTQKPVKLYEWLLYNYAKMGDRILDTHLGSGSSRIAAHKLGFDFWGYEIDKDYYDASDKRFKEFKNQQFINF